MGDEDVKMKGTMQSGIGAYIPSGAGLKGMTAKQWYSFYHRQPREPRTLRLGMATFNVGNEEPFKKPGELEDLVNLDRHDIFVLCVQEGSYVVGKLDHDEDERVHSFSRMGQTLRQIRYRIRGQFAHGTKLSARIRTIYRTIRSYRVVDLKAVAGVKQLDNMVYMHAKKNNWRIVASETMQEIRIYVIATNTIPTYRIRTNRVATGSNNLYRKGGVFIRMSICGTTFLFAGCHLAAHLHKLDARKEDILKVLRAECEQRSEHKFLLGDLNFRLDLDYEAGKTPEEVTEENSKHGEQWDALSNMIASGSRDELLQYDQLHCERTSGRMLCDFTEAVERITWDPTFKVYRGRELSPEVAKDTIVYKRKRLPAYTDRVLWKSLPALKDDVECIEYTSVPSVTTSDHKPVRSSFEVTIPGRDIAYTTFDVLFIKVFKFQLLGVPSTVKACSLDVLPSHKYAFKPVSTGSFPLPRGREDQLFTLAWEQSFRIGLRVDPTDQKRVHFVFRLNYGGEEAGRIAVPVVEIIKSYVERTMAEEVKENTEEKQGGEGAPGTKPSAPQAFSPHHEGGVEMPGVVEWREKFIGFGEQQEVALHAWFTCEQPRTLKKRVTQTSQKARRRSYNAAQLPIIEKMKQKFWLKKRGRGSLGGRSRSTPTLTSSHPDLLHHLESRDIVSNNLGGSMKVMPLAAVEEKGSGKISEDDGEADDGEADALAVS